MRQNLGTIRAKGADLHVIGCGLPAMAKDFERQYAIDTPILVDKTREAYKIAGFKRGVLRSMNPVAVLRMLRTLAAGYGIGKTQGDPWQQGGVLVVAPPGRIVYEYANGSPGDHPPLGDVLRALDKATARVA